ncbi:DUF2066 domain-containing protein [Biformimicrobium ophioploci]|uniref:DUF2066 domain-containing protein n=1 Tax=Biformimicrobium ophioploci TaxID=3036711 RepID=A0ABQ6M2Q7_9GAMM|nr:DUF2066 domain-containing protein [Microbulbifer sp. NKW57]GMG88552.1 DUF2066 domain-containing protein [Microbulbifer sp. NKW57]
MRKIGLLGRSLLAVLALGLAVWTPVQAEILPGMYEVTEIVASREASERREASGRALGRVLVRVTGNADATANPEVQEVLRRAGDYLQTYHYSNEAGSLYLNLGFEPQAINSLVQRLGLPLWPNNRPRTLVWLAADTLREGRHLVDETLHPEFLGALEGVARERGLPLVLPAQDGADLQAFHVGSLWALNEQVAQSASVRYGADVILMGRLLEATGGRWQANWVLMHQGSSFAFDSRGNSMEEVASGGISGAVGFLAQRYAVRASGPGSSEALVLELSGLNDFDDYSRAKKYLLDLAQVKNAVVASVYRDRMTLYLYTVGQLSSLQNALALDRKLAQQDETGLMDLSGYRAPLGSPENPLRYRWQ